MIRASPPLAGGGRRLIALPGSARPTLVVTRAAGRPRRGPLVADRPRLIALPGTTAPAVIVQRARDSWRGLVRAGDRLAGGGLDPQTAADRRGGQAEAERQHG